MQTALLQQLELFEAPVRELSVREEIARLGLQSGGEAVRQECERRGKPLPSAAVRFQA